MQRPGYNPTRRNRKIGTKDHGWRDRIDRPFNVPWPIWEWRTPNERWDPDAVTEIEVHGRSVIAVTDSLRKGYTFACSLKDIELVLNALPKQDVEEIGLVALHQFSPKEEIFRSFWGSINYVSNFHGYFGPAIILSSISLVKPWLAWGRHLLPDDQVELDRMRSIGFEIEETKRQYRIYCDPVIVRRSQLLHTLPHEVGHWVDYCKLVVEPAKVSDDPDDAEDELFERYFVQRPTKDREDAAWRYVREMQPRLKPLEKLF